MNKHREESELFLTRLFAKSYRVIKSLNAHYLAEMGYQDFKVGHVMVMMNLKEEGITAAEISKKVHVSKQAISKLVHELAEKGFLMNLKHPEDLRATLIQTTVSGEQFLAALNECRIKVDKELSQVIGTDKLDQIRSAMESMLLHYESNAYLDSESESFANSKL
ncbi:MarR family winged helix-turn-helix transcriptional regulator [Aquirufa lenticrescens]|uniref:MarR family winged helix-turn-helix transcriptional regulator n=1 Tax=Aquirufa lenticrescens TaxID=2696560 RepID=UPI001CAA642E|nr:MarR family transcriptional regulator [Aquirufa lenticrescens]UAJ13026.1 MarR family transcriptional regulator [Aquirufa lenticrescens]